MNNVEEFESIYRTHVAMVYNVALRMSGTATAAEEITQQTFVKAFTGAARFENRSAWKTWLYRITVNTALDYLRSVAHASSLPLDCALEVPGSRKDDPAVVAGESEQQKRLHALLDRLPEEQRACIILREFEGLSYQEIAQTINSDINTIRTRLFRAREKLMQMLQKEVQEYAV
jgi:RNA polymerase sigma-70 factor (ECF subfamily)